MTGTNHRGHEELCELLMECVLQERDHISALDLDGMQSWTERREELTREVIEVAREEPIDEESAVIYERVHQIARENLDILQVAQRSLKQLIDGLNRLPVARYDPKGKTESTGKNSRSLMTWRG